MSSGPKGHGKSKAHELIQLLEENEGAKKQADALLKAGWRKEEVLPDPEEGELVYFYTKYYPNDWSREPEEETHDEDNGYKLIPSIERAKELAKKHQVNSNKRDRCVTDYGVRHGPFPKHGSS